MAARPLRLLIGVTTTILVFSGLSSGSICKQKQVKTISESYRGYYSCGWWNWNRCSNLRYRYKSLEETVSVCCPGSYGRVSDGCPGVCPYTSSKLSSSCPGTRICRDYQCDGSGIEALSLPKQKDLTFNENDDSARLLWTVNATCFVQFSCACDQPPCTCSKTVPCTQCTVTSTNDVVEVRNGVNIYRKECPNPTCNDCSSYPGCLDYGVSYTATVECSASGYTNNGLIQQQLTLNVNEAPRAVIELPPEADDVLRVDTNANNGYVLLNIANITIPSSESSATYSLSGPVSNITGISLFQYDNSSRTMIASVDFQAPKGPSLKIKHTITSKQIKVNSDLSQERGGVYTINFCVELRRGKDCVNIEVEIERITTTPPTPTPTTASEDEEYICDAVQAWKIIPLFDKWCEMVCGPDPMNCPYLDTHCRCMGLSSRRLRCRAGGIYALSESWRHEMDLWCELNCNYGEYSNCPSDTSAIGFCKCDPPSE